MGDDLTKEVKIIITTDSSGAITGIQTANGEFEKVVPAAESAGKAMREVGETGSASFHLAGHAAAKLGEDIGIPYRASLMLGNQMAHMAATAIPGWGWALAGATIAAAVGVGVIEHFSKAEEKRREELEKSTAAEFTSTQSLYANALATEALTKDKERLAEVDQRTFLRETPKLIEMQTKEMQKLYEQLEGGSEAILSANERVRFSFTNTASGYAEKAKVVKDESDAIQEKIDKLAQSIKQEQDQMDAIKKGGASPEQQSSQDAADKEEEARRKRVDANDLEILKAGKAEIDRKAKEQADITKIVETEQEKQLTIGLDGYDKEYAQLVIAQDKEMQALKKHSADAEQINQLASAQKMALDEKESNHAIAEADREAAEKRALQSQELSYGKQISDGLIDLAMGGGKKSAEAEKDAALFKAIVNTAVAVTQALATPGPPGANFVLAELVAAAGAVQIALIESASYGGSSGGGGDIGSGGGSGGGGGMSSAGNVPASPTTSRYGTGYQPGTPGTSQLNDSIPGGGAGLQIHFNAPVYGMDDFNNKVVGVIQNNIRTDRNTQVIISRYQA